MKILLTFLLNQYSNNAQNIRIFSKKFNTNKVAIYFILIKTTIQALYKINYCKDC